jgi:hypothetical protein
VARLLPLPRTPSVVETRLPHAVPLRPAARSAGPRRRRQGPGDPRPAPPTRRPPPADPTSQAGARRPRHARCSQPRATPSPLVVLLGHARDAVALASAAGGRRVDLPAPPDRPAAVGPGGAAADRPPRQGEPPLGLPADQRRAPTAWRARLGDRDPHDPAPSRAGPRVTADGHHLAGVPTSAGRRDHRVRPASPSIPSGCGGSMCCSSSNWTRDVCIWPA